MTKIISASVTIGDKKVTIEGPEDFVREEVRRITTPISSELHASLESPLKPAGAVDEKALLGAKQPKGHAQIVAVLAFCLMESGQKQFTEDDIKRAYIRANVRPPKVIGQAIRDAKSKLDYIEPGAERGTYRLSPHGERTVRFDLPAKNKISAGD